MEDRITVNQLIVQSKLPDDTVILLKTRRDKPLNYQECTAGELKGCKKYVHYACAHKGGKKHNYNAVLVVTEN